MKKAIHQTRIFSIIITCCTFASSYASAIDYTKYGPDNSVPDKPFHQILLCSSDFQTYKAGIIDFSKHFKIGDMIIINSAEIKTLSTPKETTLAFMGDPSDDRARTCLSNTPDINAAFQRIFNDMQQVFEKYAPPGADKSSKKFSCQMSYERADGRKVAYVSIQSGKIECIDDTIANFFSYHRTD